MRLLRLVAMTIAFATFLAIPSLTSASSSYAAYIACGYKTSAPPATSCSKSVHIGAFFKSKNADVSFKACVTFPDGERQCSTSATAKQGVYYLDKLTAGSKGPLTVRWKVNGSVVASYSITVTR